jgi:hypothetical protein
MAKMQIPAAFFGMSGALKWSWQALNRPNIFTVAACSYRASGGGGSTLTQLA